MFEFFAGGGLEESMAFVFSLCGKQWATTWKA